MVPPDANATLTEVLGVIVTVGRDSYKPLLLPIMITVTNGVAFVVPLAGKLHVALSVFHEKLYPTLLAPAKPFCNESKTQDQPCCA